MAEQWVAQQFLLDAPSPQEPPSAEEEAATGLPTRVADLRDPDRTISVTEFYERLSRAVHTEFAVPVWVSGEIRKIRDTRQGHRFLELADRESDEWSGPARDRALEVVCWAREWPPVRKQLEKAGIKLAPGLVVRVQGRVVIWAGGGQVRLSMIRIDVSALLGDLAAARARLIASLEEEGLADANRRLAVPLVPLRIGVVTSAGSEAYRDFTGKLKASGFSFQVRVEDAAVQGPSAPSAVAAAVRRMARFEPDLVVLVRGGGARTDLVAFDSEPVARAIAAAPFPVWTGIGHTGDRSVADEVANRSLSTPTACGEAVVERVASYWDMITGRTRLLSAHVSGRLDQQLARVEGCSRRLEQAAQHQFARRSHELSTSAARLTRSALVCLDAESALLRDRRTAARRSVDGILATRSSDIAARRAVLSAFNPERQLERGWALVRGESGRAVRSVDDLAKGDAITIVVAGGSAGANITTVNRVGTDGE